jgi:hypothetical protein
MRRTDDASPEREVSTEPFAPAIGLLVGLGLSVPLWGVVGGLVWLARAHMRPLVGAVLAWAVALAHVT